MALLKVFVAKPLIMVLGCAMFLTTFAIQPASASTIPFTFSFTIGANTGYGTLDALDQGGGVYWAQTGSLTVTGGAVIGTYTLFPGTLINQSIIRPEINGYLGDKQFYLQRSSSSSWAA